MNKKDLKELIKPLVQDCVKETFQETLLTSGLLSQIISEVVRGVAPLLTENITSQPVQQQITTEPEMKMAEIYHKSKKKSENPENKRMLEEISKSSYGGVNIFENITDTIPDEQHTKTNDPGSPFRDIDPTDPGVDISNLFNLNVANRLVKGKK